MIDERDLFVEASEEFELPPNALEAIHRRRAVRQRARRVTSLVVGLLVALALVSTAALALFAPPAEPASSTDIFKDVRGNIIAMRYFVTAPHYRPIVVTPSGNQVGPVDIRRTWRRWMPVDFSKDGQHLLGSYLIHGENGNLRTGFAILNADGSTENLTQQGTHLGAYSLSPDGSQVAAIQHVDSSRAIVVVDVASGSVHTIVPLTSGNGITSLSWSPDGSTIAFVIGTNRTPNPSSHWRIEAVDADGSNRRVVRQISGSFVWVDGLRWSPDSTHLCLSVMRTVHDQAIFVTDSDGANLDRLTGWRRDWSPTWSPDGSQIAFKRSTPSMRGDLMVMNADGSDQHRISWGTMFVMWAPNP
jgi:Tol biopolymer transport system component